MMTFNSHWKCVCKHSNDSMVVHKNEKCYLGEIYLSETGDEIVEFKTEGDYVYDGVKMNDYVEHFLLCFEPLIDVHHEKYEDD